MPLYQERQMGWLKVDPSRSGGSQKLPELQLLDAGSTDPVRQGQRPSLAPWSFDLGTWKTQQQETPHLRNETTNHVGGTQPVCPRHKAEIAGCRNPRTMPPPFSTYMLFNAHIPVSCGLVVRLCLVGWIPDLLSSVWPVVCQVLSSRSLWGPTLKLGPSSVSSVDNFAFFSLPVESAARFGTRCQSDFKRRCQLLKIKLFGRVRRK